MKTYALALLFSAFAAMIPGLVSATTARKQTDQTVKDLLSGASSMSPVLVIDVRTQQVGKAWLLSTQPLLKIKLPDWYYYTASGGGAEPKVTLPKNELITVRVLYSGTAPVVTFGTTLTKVTTPTLTVRGLNSGDGWNQYEFLVPPSTACDLKVSPASDAAATTKPADLFDLNIGPATVADFTSQIGAMYVYTQGQGSAFGLRAPAYSISSKLSIDAVSIFGDTGTKLALGSALTYKTLLGRSDEPSSKTFFGFPAMLTFSFGFKNLSVGASTNTTSSSQIPFLAIGISIPTGKS